MALTLRLRSGDVDPPPELSFDAPRIVIGRSSGCELQLPDPSVSRRHAIIEQRGSHYAVIDQGSENGSYAGEERLAPRTNHPLRDGELLRFGRVWVEVSLDSTPVPPQATWSSRELARALVERALLADERPCGLSVRIDSGPHEGLHLLLSEPGKSYLVGRLEAAELRLPHPRVPERLATLCRRGDQVWVTALDENVSMLVSGRELRPGVATVWPRGALLELGPEMLSFEDATLEGLRRLESASGERIPDDAPVAPPVGAARKKKRRAKPKSETPSPDASGSDDDGARTDEDEDGETAPKRSARKPPAFAKNPSPERWTAADAAVFLLALGVLMLSVWAIQWIARLGQA